jgi:hypothetical protein
MPSSELMNRFRLSLGWALACVLLMAGCGDATTTDDAPSEGVFPSTPPDGPVAVAESTAGNYRPTASGAPSTDIWLAHLVIKEDGVTVNDLRNVTDRDGYDNQPSFSPDGSSLYYASAVDSTQTEIFRYGIESGLSIRLTNTLQASEFSPTFIPGQDAFSVTHEAQDLQHLWRYGSDGQEIGPILGTARPLGYHAWANNELVAMFILGDPATLVIGNALTGELRTVAERPGRSIHRIPGTEQISFVRKVSDDEWWIERLNPLTAVSERLTRTLPGREDYAWTPDGGILMADGQTLHLWKPGLGWQNIADLSGEVSGDISRMAVSQDGTFIAMVTDRSN